MRQWGSLACRCPRSLLINTIWALSVAQAEEPEAPPPEESGWSGLAQFGAGYDTNANASTSQQGFLGFILDPRFVETESAFGELTLGLNHTAVLESDRGFNSSLQFAHRANPDASFANQSVGSIGTEAVLLRAGARFTAGVSAYVERLGGENHARAGNVDLGVSRQRGSDLDIALSVRTSRIGYQQLDQEPLDVDRYLVGATLTRLNLGARSGSLGFTLLAGRDAPRRVGSPYGNNRIGVQLSTTWAVWPRASLYAELSGMRSDYAGEFFDLERQDDQYEAAMALEFADWPAPQWSVTPQLRHVRNQSSVNVFDYDRIEAALYIRRQL